MSISYEPPIEYIDVADALARIRGNEKLFKLLLSSFLADTSYNDLETHIGNNDIDSAARSAHALKGIAANLSMPALHKAVAELEGQLKIGNFVPAAYQIAKDSYALTVVHVTKLIEA